jgi:hypothetical protein
MNPPTHSGGWREQTSSKLSDSDREPAGYLSWPVLLLAGLAGLLIRVEVGRKTFIDFDEWQHAFMAASPRWTDFFFELRSNSHPALFFLLLGGIVRLGKVALYRSISIAAGTGSIVVLGLIAGRTLLSPVIQLVCTAAFAFSAAAISISIEIRSYQLAVFLALLAFLSWLNIFSRADGRIGDRRACIGFALWSSLAVYSHYSAVFFLGACIAVPLLLTAMSRRFRERWFSGTRHGSIWLSAAALAIPSAVFAVEYMVHARKLPIQGYLADFYRGETPGETAGSFTIRNFGNFFNLFSPIGFQSTTAFMVIAVPLFAGAVWMLRRWWRTRPLAAETAVAPILFAIVMTFELLTASLARIYPFGGMLRHQYIAGPFVLIAAFAVVDALVASAGHLLRRTLPALLLTAIAANLIVGWPKLIVDPGLVILEDEFTGWRSAFQDTHAVYVDHWGVIGYFIHTSGQPRRFVRRIPGVIRIDQYHIPDGTPVGTEIFYDKTRTLLDLRDPSVYRSFADCLRISGVRELSLFYFSPENELLIRLYGDPKKLVMQKAAEQGLTVTKVVVFETAMSAGFKLRE